MARQYFLAVLAGALVLMSFPPIGVSWLAWVGLMPLLWVLKKSPKIGHSMGLAFTFGLILMGGFHVWIWTLSSFGPLWGIIGLWTIYSLYLASFYTVFGIISYGLRNREGSIYILGIASGYVLTEYLRQGGPIGSPGGTLGYSHIDSVISPIASWTGIWGVSFTLILFASILLEYGHHKWASRNNKTGILPQKSKIRIATIVLCTLFLIAYVTETPPETGSFIAGSIQGAHAQNNKIHHTNNRDIQDFYLQNTRKAILQGAEIIVWPETITALLNTQNTLFMAQLRHSLNANTAVFWGTPTRENAHFYNSIVMTTQDMSQADSYQKHHLVPFGEYWPLKPWFRHLGMSNLIPGAEYGPGPTPGPLFANGFSGAICLESIYGSHFRPQVKAGSKGFIVSGNHAWYGTSSAAAKQLAMLRFRAIEYQRSIVFATNAGISALILPNGNLATVAPPHQEAVLVSQLPIHSHFTLYARYGEWFLWACLIILLLGGLKERKNF